MAKILEGDKKINLQEIIDGGVEFNDKQYLSDVYLKIFASERSMENAYFKAKICTNDGVPVKPFKVAHPLKSSVKTKFVDEVALYKDGLENIMFLIQRGKIGYFSKVTMFAQERSITYSGNQAIYRYSRYCGPSGPPSGVAPITGAHYFLNLILGEPGKKVKMSKVSKVKACKECDIMLLRYTYNWVVQRDDIKEKTCPYCKKPLEIIERDRRYAKVDLDYYSKGCSITGTNNQIGVQYYGVPIKTTVKVAALRDFLKNYQNLFPSGVIGPLDIKMNIARSRKGFNFLDAANTSLTLDKKIEWRPVILFPEDLIAA